MIHDPIIESPLHLLHRASQRATDVFDSEVGRLLTPRQYTVLAAIAKKEGLSQTDLVERTGVDRSTMADIMKRLKAKGLVQRRRTKDARTYSIRLTESGVRALRDCEPAARRVDMRILSVLGTQEQRQAFLSALNTIIAALKEPHAIA